MLRPLVHFARRRGTSGRRPDASRPSGRHGSSSSGASPTSRGRRGSSSRSRRTAGGRPTSGRRPRSTRRASAPYQSRRTSVATSSTTSPPEGTGAAGTRPRGRFGIPTLGNEETTTTTRCRWASASATRPSGPRSRSRRAGISSQSITQILTHQLYIYTLNDSPQPHRPFSFGFVNVKPVSRADSSKSMTVPTMWKSAGGSTQTVAPSASTFSWSFGGVSSA